MPEDYGEPLYVEAHGGKNDVILYRSKADPNLAIEFFFRSSSKDGRSRYYRCTKCWYLYKMKRGTCATLIVRDGRIVTDPENPGVPHQCDFRPLEAVTANRVSIAARKRKLQMGHEKMLTWEHRDRIISTQPLRSDVSDTKARLEETEIILEKSDQKVLPVGTSNCSFEESLNMPSPSTSQASPGSVETTNQQLLPVKVEEGVNSSLETAAFAQCTSRSAEFVALLNAAFADSMQKRNEEALKKLLEAVHMKEGFDTDDVSLIDNAFACHMNKAVDFAEKIAICEQWLNTLREVLPAESSRWISHYQFSVYYCFHMIGLYSLRTRTLVDRKRLFDLSQTIFKGLLECCGQVRETMEEVIASKLDILLSLSFICTQYCDVSDEESANFVQNELHAIEDCVKGSYPAETAALMVQKVYRIGDNLEKHKNALAERSAIVEHSLSTVV
ncbi:unnamed protein product [Toxocara canis]|uniref:FLYWCH-type domain-containing protein n=1 Tax=Toxocara canis TaxID=6265 RepID=A0A183UMY9_TOXCA|nr:unnamed protein product [Toxocara canis]